MHRLLPRGLWDAQRLHSRHCWSVDFGRRARPLRSQKLVLMRV